MNQLLVTAFNMVTSFAMLLIFIRFMMQFAGINARNPYAEPAYKATQVVDMFGRIFPTIGDGRISLAAIVLMFLIRLIDLAGNALLSHHSYNPLELFFEGSLSLIIDFLSMCRYVIIGSIIVSWIVVFTNSMHPIIDIIMQLAEPILAPFRKITPNLGMIDLSPMIAFFVLILAEQALSIVESNMLPMVMG